MPDYYDLIHFPMDWETMGAKLARHEYLSGGDFTVSPLPLPLPFQSLLASLAWDTG